jgi:hypothetical protein
MKNKKPKMIDKVCFSLVKLPLSSGFICPQVSMEMPSKDAATIDKKVRKTTNHTYTCCLEDHI